MHPIPRALTWAATGCAAAVAYGVAYERDAYVLRYAEAPVLPAGSTSLRILHVSDAHMTAGQTRKQRWLQGLAETEPDLVVNTGDNIADPEAIPALLRAYGNLLDLPGVFVLGSNDYFSPTFKNPARYLIGPSDVERRRVADMPWRALRAAFIERGWLDLSNGQGTLSVRGVSLSFGGVDDPHLGYDDLSASRTPDGTADLAVGVTHAPYSHVLDAWNAAGYRLILAGHTHGGQVCVPGYGALVSNCDLDPAKARGLHRHATGDREPSWVHVSAGLGTSPYAPVRFACRPEATLLTLSPVDSPRSGADAG